MDYVIENEIEEDEIRALRKKEIARMRRKKQLQLKRRRRMKKLMLRGAGVFAVVLIMAVAVVAFKNHPGDTDRVGEEKKGSAFWSQKEKEQEVAEIAEENRYQEEKIKEKNKVVYGFDTTAETAAIWQEEIISTHAILVDESTDTIVASKGAKERISPASMTKVLTVLVAAEQLEEGKLDDYFTMTTESADYGYIYDCSEVGFLEGEQVLVRDLFFGTILPSGSDAAVGLATYVAGSHEAFVDLMNEKLEELELFDTSHMTNCVGIYDENHYTTVYDMAIIMKAAMQNEWCKEVLSKHSHITTATKEHPEGINISNWFLRRIEDKDTGGEVLCAKTGYVNQSKNCAVSYGTFTDGKNYICVTAGSSSSWRCIYDHVDIFNQYIS